MGLHKKINHWRYVLRQKKKKKALLNKVIQFGDSALEGGNFYKEITFMKKKRNLFFTPYEFVEKYDHLKIKIMEDGDSGLKYVLHNGNKLFFPREFDKERIKENYGRILAEQDVQSAHRYFDERFELKDSILIDGGSAEGLISLDVIEDVKKCILVECEECWKEALENTFAPWQDKVEIVTKFLSDCETDTTTTIDAICSQYHNETIAVKMDIEGYESVAVKSIEDTIKNNKVYLTICTYHNQNDAEIIENAFNGYGLESWYSPGYCLWDYGNNLEEPYFRRGVIRATNARD